MPVRVHQLTENSADRTPGAHHLPDARACQGPGHARVHPHPQHLYGIAGRFAVVGSQPSLVTPSNQARAPRTSGPAHPRRLD